MEPVISVFAFVVFAILWISFAYALVASQGSLDAVWQWVRSQSIVVQAVVWLLFLPVTGALWVWESAWPLVVRLLLVAGLAWANLYVFFPKFLIGKP